MSLEFENQGMVADEIRLVICLQRGAFVVNGQFVFTNEWDALNLKFDGEGLLIDLFQKSASEFPMDSHGCTDDGVGQWVTFS